VHRRARTARTKVVAAGELEGLAADHNPAVAFDHETRCRSVLRKPAAETPGSNWMNELMLGIAGPPLPD